MKRISAIFLLCLLWACLFVDHPRAATTYYTAKLCSGGSAPPNCSDLNNGTSLATAKLTIGAGIGLMSGGVTLLVGNGTYAESIASTIPSGSMGARTTVQAQNYGLAILQPTGATFYVVYFNGSSYINFTGFKTDGSASSIAAPGVEDIDCLYSTTCSNINLTYDEVTGASGSAVSGQYQNSLFDHLYVHDNGTSGSNQYHGIYLAGSNNIVDHGDVENQHGGYGIQLYHGAGSADNNIVRNTFVKGGDLFGILTGRASELLYNDIIVSNGSAGVEVYSSAATNTRIYNLTVYSNGGDCIDNGDVLGGIPSGSVIQNIICYSNGGNIVDKGTGSTISNNTTANPSFVSPPNNLSLQSGSIAIGAGVNLYSTFTTDYAGNARPLVGTWDAGAP